MEMAGGIWSNIWNDFCSSVSDCNWRSFDRERRRNIIVKQKRFLRNHWWYLKNIHQNLKVIEMKIIHTLKSYNIGMWTFFSLFLQSPQIHRVLLNPHPLDRFHLRENIINQNYVANQVPHKISNLYSNLQEI